MSARAGRLAATAMVALLAGCAAPVPVPVTVPAPAPGPALDAAVRPPPPEPGQELLAPERIAALPPPLREAWKAYVAASAERDAANRAAIRAELASIGRERWTPAPEGRAFESPDDHDDAWWRGAEAAALADAILSFQTPSGGWSKRIDYSAPRAPGTSYSVSDGWSYIATFDNAATVEEIRFLAALVHRRPEPRYREALRRGVEYVLAAQYPNGCWPQVYPLRGSYHDAVTFNDDAMVRVLRLLRDLNRYHEEVLPGDLAPRVERAFARGIDCIVASQVVVDGVRTVWAAQHDPLSLVPVPARAYEPAALSGAESVDVMELLMGLRSPAPEVVAAVHGAAAWFERTAIHGFDYDPRRGLVARAGAGPIWARFYEISTGRPIFSNRDGAVLYDWSELEEERRSGYTWFRADASRALRRYQEWAREHPR